eukprot:8713053-Alexandrium_andersonii.AAC.1
MRRFGSLVDYIRAEAEMPDATAITTLEAAAWLATASAEQLETLAVTWRSNQLKTGFVRVVLSFWVLQALRGWAISGASGGINCAFPHPKDGVLHSGSFDFGGGGPNHRAARIEHFRSSQRKGSADNYGVA